MVFVELIVNRPIRRSFHHSKGAPSALDPLSDPAARFDPLSDTPLDDGIHENDAAFQLFHYHLPVELEDVIQPGHLVWVPFGAQEVQGFIVNRTTHTPVPTRAVLRLARAAPVLTPAQLALAAWIADYYVAPISEAVKLFLPPGLLSKEEGRATVRSKRELQIVLAVAPEEAIRRLSTLGRETQQTRVLSWFLQQIATTQLATTQITQDISSSTPWIPLETIQQACQLKSPATINTLAKQGFFTIEQVECVVPETVGKQAIDGDRAAQVVKDGLGRQTQKAVRLAVSLDEATSALQTLRGTTKLRPVLQILAEAEGPLWKSDLYARVEADLTMLRTLQRAGLIAMSEEIRFRDPLVGRTYAQTAPPIFTTEQNAVWQQIQAQGFRDSVVGQEVTATQMRDAASKRAGDTAGNHENSPVNGTTSFRPSDSSQHHAAKFLLHGVTGSGKTEIYLRAIDETLKRGQQAIVLVPEIALTPQTVARFAGRFPGRVTVIHSALSTGERYDVWRHLRDDAFDVVVGPRSALFAPMKRLGLIILDEEHESSYKQNSEAWGSFTVFYDARTVAAQLAELTGSTLVYGSATPSLERYAAAQAGELILLEMLRRVMGHGPAAPAVMGGDEAHTPEVLSVQIAEGTGVVPRERKAATIDGGYQTGLASQYTELPPVEIVDMRQELRAGHRSILSRALLSELHTTLDAGEQAILFLNRRGTRTFVMCRDCGNVQQCMRCDVPLTFHENTNILICHHCNRREPIPEICSECNSKRIKYFGSGTQRLEELIQQVAPRAKIMRWDADTASAKGSHEEILRRFSAHEADILVGTQMIAKGLDFPLVTLVGVVAADIGLYLPDFRSGERAFQLLTQVAGRAGRSERGGRVVIQSYKPEHYAIQAAAQHDYHAFYAREITFRKEHGYPPMRAMARLIYWDKKLEKAEDASSAMAELLRNRLQQLGIEGAAAMVLGPAPAFFARYRGYYRWQVILRAPHPAQILRSITIPFGWRVDIDPVSML